MGFRWTISLVFPHFLALYRVLFFSPTLVIGTWYLVSVLVIFLFAVFFSISSDFPPLGFYLFVGPQEFWAMELTFILYLRDAAIDLEIGTLLVLWFRRLHYIAHRY